MPSDSTDSLGSRLPFIGFFYDGRFNTATVLPNANSFGPNAVYRTIEEKLTDILIKCGCTGLGECSFEVCVVSVF